MDKGVEQALEYAARNMRDPVYHNGKRSPKVARCPVCGTGIRAIAGDVRQSLAMHMQAKGCDSTKEGNQ